METKGLGKSIVGVWSTRTIVAVAIGAALFGVLMNYGGIPVFTNTSLTTAMIVPVVVGAMYGALPAAVAAGVGNVIADLIGGWGLWFDWSVGNLVAGCFVGLGAYMLMRKFDAKNVIIYIVLVALGNGVSVEYRFFYLAPSLHGVRPEALQLLGHSLELAPQLQSGLTPCLLPSVPPVQCQPIALGR